MAKSVSPQGATQWQHLSLAVGGSIKTVYAAGGRLISMLGTDLATVFLVPLPWFGVLLWFAIAQSDLRRAGFGVIGLVSGHIIVHVLGISDTPTLGGGVKANALLTAISVSWLTAPLNIPVEAQILIATISAAAAAITTAAITRALARANRRRRRPFRAGDDCDNDGGYGLPSLASGYSLVAGALFVLFSAWTSLAVNVTAPWITPTDALGWLYAFLRSLGSLLFSPTVAVGVMIALALLLWSRALLITGTIGWLSGGAAALVMQDFGVNYYWLPASYNFFLAGMALGAVFLLPGRTSLPMAAFAGFGASVLAVVLQQIAPAWAYLPISSILTTWVGLGAFTISEDRSAFWRNYAHQIPPEEAWSRELNWADRFGRREPLLVVPLAGAVQVTQGFDGKLSHAGRWRHALDFQRPAAAGDDSTSSIWETPVTAPAAGVVERVQDSIADNPLGICNYADNWGNYILIRLDQSGWAFLAHLRQHSIAVKAGSRVEIGTLLAAVGNSGRSPVPHLHLQVQRFGELGAPTVPFWLANYQSTASTKDAPRLWHAMAIPAETTIVTASRPNPVVHSILASIAPGMAIWMIEAKGRIPRAFHPASSDRSTEQIEIRIDTSGRHVFTSPNGGMAVASIDVDAWRVLELNHKASPFLRLLALAAPSIPYAARSGMSWQEPAPFNAISAGWLGVALMPYVKRPFIRLSSTCSAEPASQRDPIAIETRVAVPRASLPLKLECQFERLRGPVRIEAIFKGGGSLLYSLLSFEPGLPFGKWQCRVAP